MRFLNFKMRIKYMSGTSSARNEQPSRGFLPSYFSYAVPPLAASGAIVPVFRDLVAKSALQQGLSPSRMTIREGIRAGFAAAPTVGFIVGAQMLVQPAVEKRLMGGANQASFPTLVGSSALVGAASAPVLAIFNGQTMKWGVMKSLRNFSVKQGAAITFQETAFVFGMSVADRLALAAKRRFEGNKVVEYGAAFTGGAFGSLAGHPANTALTRWQNGMTLDSFHQSMWGSLRKARAIGLFACFYKFGKETLSSAVEK